MLGEAEKGEGFSQVGLPKHDGLFTCHVVAFVWVLEQRQKRRSCSPKRTTSVVCAFPPVCVCLLHSSLLQLACLTLGVFFKTSSRVSEFAGCTRLTCE